MIIVRFPHIFIGALNIRGGVCFQPQGGTVGAICAVTWKKPLQINCGGFLVFGCLYQVQCAKSGCGVCCCATNVGLCSPTYELRASKFSLKLQSY